MFKILNTIRNTGFENFETCNFLGKIAFYSQKANKKFFQVNPQLQKSPDFPQTNYI